MWLVTVVPGRLLRSRLKVMPLVIATRGNSVQSRNTTPIGCRHGGIWATLTLLTSICLWLGILKLVSMCSSADPL